MRHKESVMELKKLREQWEHGCDVVAAFWMPAPEPELFVVIYAKGGCFWDLLHYFPVGDHWHVSIDVQGTDPQSGPGAAEMLERIGKAFKPYVDEQMATGV